MKFEAKPYGLDAVLISFGSEINLNTHACVKRLYHALRSYGKKGIRALIPSYCGLTVMFEPTKLSYNDIVDLSEDLLCQSKERKELQYKVKIPVCYDKSFALDWNEITDYIGLSWEDIIGLHYSNEYVVYMLGCVPGFFYLGGLNPQIRIPRKISPRLKMPKGAVGLADDQTGIYPLETPGGWQVIGSSPVELMTNRRAFIEMGDYLEFFPISKKEHFLCSKQIQRILVNES